MPNHDETVERVALKERVLGDDYPIYGDYLYVVDGEVYRNDFHGITVSELKRRLRATEVRNCDIFGRQALASARRLAAAAPTMFEALTACADHLEGIIDRGFGNDLTRQRLLEARAALASARPQTEKD